MKTFKQFFEETEIESLEALIANPDPSRVKMYGGGTEYVDMLKRKLERAKKSQAIQSHLKKSPLGRAIEDDEHDDDFYDFRPGDPKHETEALKKARKEAGFNPYNKEEDAADRCKRKADQVYGKKTSAYKSGAIVRCRKGKIWKKK
jgi:hypothetical protein|tara:strand:+ start:8077 stop:8514 length:438 start_codon:yes stop_codon:yes gene_type:complete